VPSSFLALVVFTTKSATNCTMDPLFQLCEPLHKTQHCYPPIAWPASIEFLYIFIVIPSLKPVYVEILNKLVDLNDDDPTWW
jgi:hypothetical protein